MGGFNSRDQEWPEGVQRLINEAHADFDELREHLRLEGVAELAKRTRTLFDPTYFPMYFTGKFESPFVLVHLNPKLSERLRNPHYSDFDDYLDCHRNFGFRHWILDPTYKSAFDHKQVRFLKPFHVIDFHPDSEPGSQRANAALACDEKLQLELVPYASPGFAANDFSVELLQPHFERVLEVILAYPRDYVIFCGVVFDAILNTSDLLTSRHDHRFHLPTKAGVSQMVSRFSTLELAVRGSTIRAGVAQSFAKQGIPMPAYGAKCHALYKAALDQ